MDFGTIVVILAVTVFYVRLILIQRRKGRSAPAGSSKNSAKQGAQGQPAGSDWRRYSIISQRRSDWIIAGLGLVAMLAGLVINLNRAAWPGVAPYWWIPFALGILAFSWGFR